MRIKILGKYWELKFCTVPTDCLGMCDPPDKPNKQIKISNKLSGQTELDVIIHECFHAGNWHVDEEYVDRFSTDLAHILWKLGYRKDK